MKPLRNRIRDASRQLGIPQQVIEKDYALSYILAGISSQPEINNALVFKGGTALKKLFFGDYRFSEDLDFSSVDSPTGEQLENAILDATANTLRLLSEQGQFILRFERYLEREPHPHGQDAFIIRLQFPWHPSPLCRIKIEITHDEPVLMAPETRRLIHGYDEKLVYNVSCYHLEEIVAEKLRTLLQTHQKLILRGWNRPRARDYYDLWRIMDKYYDRLSGEQILLLLERKCEHRGVSFQSLDDFFSEKLITEAYKHWEPNLAPFVAELPDCSAVLKELRILLSNLIFGRGPNPV
ncbi:MAG: nucleotidyl transferase AbiEii/AbiGii toxin family protein [Candidatus Hatepunaea meridiana]|nr:nucleotidyl transferase AbiEii/AbiGii toxin family protein [Candidatus Hatepunaea meridiana]